MTDRTNEPTRPNRTERTDRTPTDPELDPDGEGPIDESAEAESVDTMADVSHTPPFGRGANRVFKRGNELLEELTDEAESAPERDTEADEDV